VARILVAGSADPVIEDPLIAAELPHLGGRRRYAAPRGCFATSTPTRRRCAQTRPITRQSADPTQCRRIVDFLRGRGYALSRSRNVGGQPPPVQKRNDEEISPGSPPGCNDEAASWTWSSCGTSERAG
jgi:hypothetical protein